MKIAVSSTGQELNSVVESRFGRCEFFVVVETENGSFKAFENDNRGLSSGAGIQAASFIASEGVEAVITGNCGPKAMQVLTAAGIDIFSVQGGSVSQVVEQFNNKTLSSLSGPSAAAKSGVGQDGESGSTLPGPGGGRGMGGGGRGMGGGGRGMGGGGRGMGGGGGQGMGGRRR